jgi:hypothetical protein
VKWVQAASQATFFSSDLQSMLVRNCFLLAIHLSISHFCGNLPLILCVDVGIRDEDDSVYIRRLLAEPFLGRLLSDPRLRPLLATRSRVKEVITTRERETNATG